MTRYILEPFGSVYHLDRFDADFSAWCVIVPLRHNGYADLLECQVPPVIPQTTEETR